MFIRRLPKFEYHTPSSVKEALELRSRYGGSACFLAGGTDLLVAMKNRVCMPEHLISLTGIAEMKGISLNGNGELRVGALTTLAEIEYSDIVKEQFPALRDAVDVMASRQIRTMATIGGNLFAAVPSADTAPPLIALNASLTIAGNLGEQTMPVESLFTGPKQTCCTSGEILVHIAIPKPEPFSGGCYLKLMRRQAMDLALVGVAAYVKLDGKKGVCKDARIALGAVAPTPIRVPEAEDLLVNKTIDEALAAQTAKIAGARCYPITDIRASLDYRCSMAEVLTRRAIMGALRRISE
jgi:carbon-monoxide dehydrogenase medium subunit